MFRQNPTWNSRPGDILFEFFRFERRVGGRSGGDSDRWQSVERPVAFELVGAESCCQEIDRISVSLGGRVHLAISLVGSVEFLLSIRVLGRFYFPLCASMVVLVAVFVAGQECSCAVHDKLANLTSELRLLHWQIPPPLHQIWRISWPRDRRLLDLLQTRNMNFVEQVHCRLWMHLLLELRHRLRWIYHV